jgi:hypothetical protein
MPVFRCQFIFGKKLQQLFEKARDFCPSIFESSSFSPIKIVFLLSIVFVIPVSSTFKQALNTRYI